MRGSQDESSGCVLRGHVRLNLKEPTKFKAITLRLTGKIKVAWSECKLIKAQAHYELQKHLPCNFKH